MRLHWILSGCLVSLIKSELDSYAPKTTDISIFTKGTVEAGTTMVPCSGCFWPSSTKKNFSQFHLDFVKQRETEFSEFLSNEYYWLSFAGNPVHQFKNWDFIWTGAKYLVHKQECKGDNRCTIKMTYLGDNLWSSELFSGPKYNHVGNLTSEWTYSIDHHRRSVITHTFSKSSRSIWFNPVKWQQFDTYYYKYFSGIEGYAHCRNSSMKLVLKDPIINQDKFVLEDGIFGYESQALLEF